MTQQVTIYRPKNVREPERPKDVCLELQKLPGAKFVLLHIVDPDTGEHVTGGNLMNIYPDGRFKLIGGAKFGDVIGFKERGVE